MNFKWGHRTLAAAVLVSSLSAEDLTPAKALDNLEKAAAGDPAGVHISQMVPYWRNALERESYQEFENFRLPIDESDEGSVAAAKKFEKEISEFTSSIRRQKAERIRIETERVTALLSEAGKAIENAQKPEDLDEVIKSLLQIKMSGYASYDEGLRNVQQQIQTSRQIAAEWQVYLNEKEFNRPELAAKSLNRISDHLTSFPLIPRSKILRMMKEESGIAPGVDTAAGNGLQSIELIQKRFDGDGDVDKALQALDSLPRGLGTDRGRNFHEALVSFKKFRESIDSISLDEAIRYLANFSYSSPVLATCSDEVNKLISTTLKVAPPSKRMSTDHYIRVVAADATAREDWQLALKVWSLGTPLRVGDGDSAAISAYLKGQELEKVGMWAQAVLAYRVGLEEKLIYIPREKFTERLLAMQKENPERYEQARKDADTFDRLGKEQAADIVRNLYRGDGPNSSPRNRDPRANRPSEAMIVQIREEIRGVLDERKEAAELVKPDPAKPVPAQAAPPAER